MNLLTKHEQVQNCKNTTLHSLNSGELMTAVLLEQMLLMLCWVLIGASDEIVSNAAERALRR